MLSKLVKAAQRVSLRTQFRSFAVAQNFASSQLQTTLDSASLMNTLYGNNGETLEIKSVVNAMTHMQSNDLSFSEYREISPMADELMIYLEDCLDGQEYVPGSISAS